MQNDSLRSTKKKRLTLIAGILLLIGLSVFGVSRFILKRPGSNIGMPAVNGASSEKVDINKDINIPIKDNTGKQLGTITMNLQNAETQDTILVNGQEAKAISGRTFLIINLKLTNPLNQTVNINTRDYIRLSVNGNQNEWLAADIHNDPVEVQAISTKYTRLGFPINKSDTNLVLQVGEITGDKQKIPLNLQ